MSDIERSAVVIAITGGIACGKSEVGRILGHMGYSVCDTDRVAHELMTKGMPVYQKVVEFFGTRILTEDREISRPKLGEIVFETPAKLMELNRLIHPAVRSVIEEWISQRRRNQENAAAQIPLLFESGMQNLGWDAVVCVSSSEEQVYERLEKRGVSRQKALRRIAAQMPLAEKENLSDRVIRNFGTLQELEEATRKTMASLIVER